MTLKDFLDKYHSVILRKDVCEKLGISYSRLNVLEKGGAHKSMAKYAPLIEAMIPNCKDKIYIPTKEEKSPITKRKERVPFTDDEMNIIKEKAYLLNNRTLRKILDGYTPTRHIHDRIIAKVYSDDLPTTNMRLIKEYYENS